MVSLTALWLPIVLSAVLAFAASVVTHVVFSYHETDFGAVPAEDRVMAALRESGVSPGAYTLPHAADSEERASPEFKERAERGPVAILTVLDGWSGVAMGRQFVQWFLYCLAVSVFAAYVTGRAVGPGVEYLEAFRFTGTVAFVGYAVALWQESIWYGRPWSVTLKNTLDGVAYALLTAGVFGWLWPG